MHASNIALPAPVPHREECRVNKLPKTIAITPFFVSTKWLQGNLLTLLYRMYQIHLRRLMPRRRPSHEEALSTNTENHWNQAVARVSRTVRAACVCMASSHTSNARPSVWRQAFVDVGGEDRIRYAASHPSRRAATRSVSVLPAGFEGGPSRASPIPHTTHPKQRCCAQNAF